MSGHDPALDDSERDEPTGTTSMTVGETPNIGAVRGTK
jgi:hypothetical protein